MNHRNFASLVAITRAADVYGALLSFLAGRTGETPGFCVKVTRLKATPCRILRSFSDDGDCRIRVNR